jgi:hypothetical protein
MKRILIDVDIKFYIIVGKLKHIGKKDRICDHISIIK